MHVEPAFRHGAAIELLTEHTHSISVRQLSALTAIADNKYQIPRVVAQLKDQRQYLFMYLDALFDKDPHLAMDYSDMQV